MEVPAFHKAITESLPDERLIKSLEMDNAATSRRTWESIKQMTPGSLDALAQEMVYLAVSVTSRCGYCIGSHTAAARKTGMSDEMFAELLAVVGMANETNRLVTGYQVEINPQYRT